MTRETDLTGREDSVTYLVTSREEQVQVTEEGGPKRVRLIV